MTPAPTLPRLGDITRDQYQKTLALDYARWLACLAETEVPSSASRQFLLRWPRSVGATVVRKAVEDLETKSAVAVGTGSDAVWAGPLAPVQPFLDAFVAIARGAALLGRIPGVRKVPFRVSVPTQTAGANYVWVSEGAPKPPSVMAFANGPILTATKHQAIVVVTQELLWLAVSGMESALLDELVTGLTAFSDKQFLDPTVAAVAGKNPASVTNGTVPITATASYAADVQSLLTAFFAARPNAQEPVLITNAGHAAQIRSMNGGGGVGLPVLVSEAALGNTVAVDGRGVFLADDGVAIDVTKEATLQMSDTPDHPVVATTVQVSLWQMNCVGYRVERFVNWTAAAGAVKYLAG
jgi:hypothetical protein